VNKKWTINFERRDGAQNQKVAGGPQPVEIFGNVLHHLVPLATH